MPFVSAAQRRACYAKETLDRKAGRTPAWDCAEFGKHAETLPQTANYREKLRRLWIQQHGLHPDTPFHDAARHAGPRNAGLVAHATVPNLTGELPQKLCNADLAKMVQNSNAYRNLKPAGVPSNQDRLKALLAGKEPGIKGAAVLPEIRASGESANTPGDRVSPPLLINPYVPTDPEAAQEYENGYEFAQEIGGPELTASGRDISQRPAAWQEGFAEGARSVGSGNMKTSTATTIARMKEAGAWNALAPAVGSLAGAGLGAGGGYAMGPSVIPSEGFHMPTAPAAPDLPAPIPYFGGSNTPYVPETFRPEAIPGFQHTLGEGDYATNRAEWQQRADAAAERNQAGQQSVDELNDVAAKHDAGVRDQQRILSGLAQNDVNAYSDALAGHRSDVLDRQQAIGAAGGAALGGVAGGLAGRALAAKQDGALRA